MDFYGPFPSSEYILVVVDAFSRFPIAEIVRSTAAPTIIPKLDQIFAMDGLPEEIVTEVIDPLHIKPPGLHPQNCYITGSLEGNYLV